MAADSRGGDFLAFKIFRAGDLRSGDKPLKHPIVGRDNNLQRRVAASDADKGAATRARELNIAAEHGLDASRGSDENDSVIQPFFLHVALLLRHGIDHHLKALRGDRHVDGLEGLSIPQAPVKERQTENYGDDQELTQRLRPPSCA